MFGTGIQLLPCANGEFEKFGNKEAVYIPTHDIPRALFPGLDNIFIAENLDDLLMSKLSQVATEGNTFCEQRQ